MGGSPGFYYETACATRCYEIGDCAWAIAWINTIMDLTGPPVTADLGAVVREQTKDVDKSRLTIELT